MVPVHGAVPGRGRMEQRTQVQLHVQAHVSLHEEQAHSITVQERALPHEEEVLWNVAHVRCHWPGSCLGRRLLPAESEVPGVA